MIRVRRGPLVVICASVGVVGAACVGLTSQQGAEALVKARLDPLVVAVSSTTAPSTTTTSTTATTAPAPAPTTTAPPVRLRQPVSPPLDGRAYEPAIVIGFIEIPRLGLAVPLNQGVSLVSIDRGPSQWPGTALPGEIGNVVVAGHRVTHSAPFRNIDQLVPGDEVVMTSTAGRFVYRVTVGEVVTPDALSIVDQTPEPRATLFACHPPGSAKYRYVVHLALEGPPVPSA